MIKEIRSLLLVLSLTLFPVTAIAAEQAGGIRGMVYDADFDAPLPAAEISIAETGQKVTATDSGNFVFSEVKPGTYTLVFSKEGYARQVKADVVVSPGKMTELDASLAGDFTEMEEFVVQDMQIGAGSESALLDLRIESPALMDSIGSELMSRAGAGDAASALRLVAGTTVQDGKYATVRGLPDRYVNSQMNGVRLPTADSDKRAVQLDQFPAAVIESIQVSKTFTPDQQGDASGGAVNIVLKGVPQERIVNFSGQTGFNTNVRDAGSDFLSYKGGGVNTWAKDDGSRDMQQYQPNQSWSGAVGPSPTEAPMDYKWSVAAGDKFNFDKFKLGAFGSFFYERSSSYYEKIDDSFWALSNTNPNGPLFKMSPLTSGVGSPSNDNDPWFTSLFDVRQASETVKWGGLGVLGIETEHHSLSFLNMYTRDATDKVTIGENTRGRESLATYWPEYYSGVQGIKFTDYFDQPYFYSASPPQRNETLEYTERTTSTQQLHGKHTLPDLELGVTEVFMLGEPEVDWMVSMNSATLYQPDKRQFATMWLPSPPGWEGFHYPDPKYAYGIGNLQRTWKDIQEDSDQYFTNLKLPFEQWSGDTGYFKFGLFHDKVQRTYRQDSFSNANDDNNSYYGDWDKLWSLDIPNETHIMQPSYYDVDYDGKQKISAYYWMTDLPLNSYFNILGGVRFENTDLSIINSPDMRNGSVSATYYSWGYTPQGNVWVSQQQFDPAKTDVKYNQNDILPSIGYEFKPWKPVVFRGNYSETVARQTFKELSPIQQQEYLGGDIFVGNPGLEMSSLKNYDLRLDYTPYEGGLVSMSWFKKDVTNPIENIQVIGTNDRFTSVMNYPKGQLHGYEFEIRQQLKHLWEELDGFGVGANATLIESEVTLPDTMIKSFNNTNIPVKSTRDMTNAPNHLYNFFTTYDLKKTGTQLALFYTIRGDTLIKGANTISNNVFVPSVYETEYGTLNFSLSQKLGEIWTLKFQAKNILDPAIETVYRSDSIGEDVTRGSYHRGMDFSIGLGATF